MRLPPYLAGALLLVTLAGCESDEKKLERLKKEEALSSLSLFRYKTELDSIARTDTAEIPGAARAAYEDSVRIAENRRDLAQRELNLFMSGK